MLIIAASVCGSHIVLARKSQSSSKYGMQNPDKKRNDDICKIKSFKKNYIKTHNCGFYCEKAKCNANLKEKWN